MSKYIDADLLRKEIEFAKSVYSHPNRVTHGVADAFRQDGRAAMCDDILEKIDSLQQEPSEVDLEKEIIRYQREDMDRDTTVGDVARHFYELGLKQQGVPLPEDTVIFQNGVAEGRRLERQDNAKWSDEDAEMIRIIQNRLQKFSEWATEQGYPKDAIKPKPEDWLASLRPRQLWVPSDEEISWLKTAYKLSKDKPSIHGIIGSLINGIESIKQEGQR